jgi:CPA1 family monovalent cation:H+ antiporter
MAMLAQTLASVLALLFAVVLFATVALRLRLPYPSLLALGGLVMALIPGLPRSPLAPDIVLLVFLPPLLFGAGWRIPWSELVGNVRPIAVLAVGLVLFTTVGVGLAAHALDAALPLGAALVLGAIVSPTDPLAASAVSRQVQLPRRIISILEGEGLANDATGLVVYRLAVAAMIGGSFGLVGGVYMFLVMATGGVAIGAAVGWVSVQLQRVVADPPIEFALQLLTGYAAYLPAERIGVSGVFAAATAGLVCGQSWSRALGARSRLQAVAVWDTLDFLVNAALFLLLGLQLPVVLAQAGGHSLGRLVVNGLGVSLLAVALRMGWVFAGALVGRLRAGSGEARAAAQRPPANVIALLGWSGMRGVLSLATALAVPQTIASGAPFPGRATILFYAFCVIVVTLVLQGLSLPLVIRLFRIARDEPRHEEHRVARIRTARAARDRLDELIADGDELTRELGADLRARTERLLLHLESRDVGRVAKEIARLRGEVARAERRALLDLHARRIIDDQTFRQLERELDIEEQLS